MPDYNNPPITEALFEIQIEPDSHLNVEALDRLAQKFSGDFPDKKLRRRFESRFEFKENLPAETQTVDLGAEGFVCWDTSKTEVAQFRLDGFAYSRLRPYQGWEKAFQKTIQLWKEYKEVANPTLIRRVVVRFINTINVPHSRFELSQYLSLAPQLPVQNGEIHGFLSRVSFALPDTQAKANLIQALAHSTNPLVTPLIVDLEVAREVGANLELAGIEEIMNSLRPIKNDLFERCITNASRGLFQ